MFLTSAVEVEFKEDSHQYFRNGVEYLSQSGFVSMFIKPFDTDLMSRMKAKSLGISQKAVLAMWDKTRNDAASFGTETHQVIEDSWNGKYVPPKYKILVDQIRTLTQPYKMVFPEKVMYLDEFRIAGTADHPQERCRIGGKQVIDMFDYKTNVAKGVTLYGCSYKEGKWSHYPDKWFLGPISHLEDSLYVKDCLQLSIYMYMAEINYDVLPGRLGIVYINHDLIPRVMPVPYMKMEVIAMLNWYKNLKTIK